MEIDGYRVTVSGRHFTTRKSDWNKNISASYSNCGHCFRNTMFNKEYVEISYNKSYDIQLKNSHPIDCQSRVMIEGIEVGIWTIPAFSSIRIERPFISENPVLIDDTKKGLIQVEFIPQKRQEYDIYEDSYYQDNFTFVNDYKTNLWEKVNNNPEYKLFNSNNYFEQDHWYGYGKGIRQPSVVGTLQPSVVGPIDLDHSKKVIINIRMIVKQENQQEVHDYPKSNPIPPIFL